MNKMVKNQNIIVFVSSLVFLITNIDVTIVNVAMPVIANFYKTDIVSARSIIIGFLIAYAVAIPLVEYFVDQIGLKNVLLIATFLFAFSSFLCGISTNINYLTLSRILQGLSAGCFTPVARSILLKISDKKSLPINLNNAMLLGILGQSLGPFIGGYLIKYFNWKMIFFINIPLCIIVFVLVLLYVERKIFDDIKRYSLDYLGFALISIFLIPLFYILDAFGDGRFLNTYIILNLGIVILSSLFLYKHIKNYKYKQLLNYDLLKRNSNLRWALISSGISRFCVGAMPFFIVLYLHDFKFSEVHLGYILLSYGLGMWITKFFAKKIYNTLGMLKSTQLSIAIVFILSNAIFISILYYSNFYYVIFTLFILGFFISFFFGAGNILTFQTVENTDSISVSVFQSLNMYLSSSMGVALLTIFIVISKYMTTQYYLTGFFILTLSLLVALACSLKIKMKAEH